MTTFPTTLEFHKGGVVIYNEWVYDSAANTGQYVPRDITEKGWIHKRDQHVTFMPDVTLNDVFLFLARDVPVCDIVFANCFVADLVNAWNAINPAVLSNVRVLDSDSIEYIEVYWGAELFTFNGVTDINGLSMASCHGIGIELTDDVTEDGDWVIHKKGDRIQWGLDFVSIESLVAIPIRLNTEFTIPEEWSRTPDYLSRPPLVRATRPYTLHEAIEAVCWELSFYGGPDDTAELSDDSTPTTT